MKIAVFGGTFNPPHIGHTNIISTYLEKYKETSYLIVVPTGNPPHKNIDMNIDIEHKKIICKYAFENIKKVKMDFYDLERSNREKTYSIDTVNYLIEKYNLDTNKYKIDFLIGDDLIPTIPYWGNIESLIKKINFVIFKRTNKTYTKEIKIGNQNLILKYIDNKIINISSSNIRNLINKNKYDKINMYLDKKVFDYIVKNKFYANSINTTD